MFGGFDNMEVPAVTFIDTVADGASSRNRRTLHQLFACAAPAVRANEAVSR